MSNKSETQKTETSNNTHGQTESLPECEQTPINQVQPDYSKYERHLRGDNADFNANSDGNSESST